MGTRWLVWIARLTPFVAASAIICIIFAVITPKNHYGAFLFSLHPILMTAAFVCFMPFALTTYRLEAFDAQSHGMAPQDLPALRRFHLKWQIAAGVAAVSGLAAIFINKAVYKHPLLSNSAHAVVGGLVLVGVFIQASVGFLKIRTLETNGQKVHKWHGTFGLLVYSLGVLALSLGALKTLTPPLSVVVIALEVIVWLFVVGIRIFLPFPSSDGGGENDMLAPNDLLEQDMLEETE